MYSDRCRSLMNWSTYPIVHLKHFELYLHESKMEPNIYHRFIDVNILSWCQLKVMRFSTDIPDERVQDF